MRLLLCLLSAILLVTVASPARAQMRPFVDVGWKVGRTSSLVEVTQGAEGAKRRLEVAGGLGGRFGMSGNHFVAGGAIDVWGATAAAGSAAFFGGVAARSRQGLGVELTGSLGGQSYDGYVDGGFYTDVDTTSVQLLFAGGQLQTWVPLGSRISLGLFAEARTDLHKGTGTASVIHRCGTVCDLFGGQDSAPEPHEFSVGGQTYFAGMNIRFSGKPTPSSASE
jgi:hypothetical protein